MGLKNKELLTKAFSQTLQELRKEKNLTQDDLANNMEVDRAYISQIERGVRLPSLVTVYKLAEALKLAPLEILGKVDQVYNELLENK